MKKHTLSLVLFLFISCCCLGREWGTPPNYHIRAKAHVSDSSICRGDSITLSVSVCYCGLPPYTYSWSPSIGVRYDTARVTKTAPSHTTTYTITVTDQNGVSGTASVRVVVDSIHVSITGSNICLGSVGWLTAAVSGSNNVPPYTYSWSPSGGTTQTATIVSAGTYTVIVTDSNGCSVTKSDSIKSSATLTVTANPTANVLCNGGSDGSAGVSVSGGTPPYTYSWSSGGTNSTKTGMTAGTYTITLTDGCGATATDSVIITQPPPLIVSADTDLTRFLTGDSLIAVGGTPPYTYSWSPPVSSASLLLLTDTTIFTLIVTDAKGCSSTSHATFIPTPAMAASCKDLFISVYINDTVDNDDAIEVYNPSPAAILLDNYYLTGTTLGSIFAPPFFIRLSGSIPAYSRYVVANSHADVTLTSLANMLTDTLNFKGKDVVELAYIAPTISGVVVKLLDKIGDYTVPPTDSGWAVNSGSTKNHTLSRYVSVVEGDPDWTTCQSQWNVYPQGTFSELGHYENICYIDPDITFSLGDTSLSCGDSSFFSFDILVSSSKPTIFNNCELWVTYPPGEFSGDNFSNGGIIVSRGPDFQTGSGNDYGNWSASPGTDNVNLVIGSGWYTSPKGTIIDSIPRVLWHVQLKIQNCETGAISFADTVAVAPYSGYTMLDSILSHIDSTKSYYDTCCSHLCGTHQHFDSLCNYHCCDWDDDDNCISYCWDSCYSYIPFYCPDTIWHYTKDSIYTIVDSFDMGYNYTFFSDSITTASCSEVHLDPIWTPINAGTNDKSIPRNSSILKLTGYGFGNIRGKITVPDANTGDTGRITLDNMDILSWADNKIVVKMPSVKIGNNLVTPGSGLIRVFNVCDDSAQKPLTINYSIFNFYEGSEKYRDNIVMVNDTASLLFRCDTSISNYPRIYADVLQAIETWNCYTGVNWKLGKDTTGDTIEKLDGVSSIYFTTLPPGRLMETQPNPQYLCNDNGDSMAFVYDADIAINRIPYPGYTWNYNVSDTVFHGNHYVYFFDVLMHELGHAHLLNHIDDTNSLMYYQEDPSKRKNILGGVAPGPQTLYGAFDVVSTDSAFTNTCKSGTLKNVPRGCRDTTLDIPTITKNAYNLTLYPNPASNGSITIAYELTKNSDIQFKITDCVGRQLMIFKKEVKPPGKYTEQINISAWAQGVYLFIANINGEFQTIKFIKL